MAEENSSQEKTEEPSEYRIEESRKKGQVASSKELNSVLVLAACLLTLGLSSVYIFETLDGFFRYLLKVDPTKVYSEKTLQAIFEKMISTSLKCVAPLFIVSFIVGIITQVMQVGLLFAPDVLQMKLERINPLEGVKRLASKKSAVEAIKGLFKFVIILSITYFVMKDDLPTFTGFLQIEFVNSFVRGKLLMLKISYSIIAGMIVVALGDFAWEKYSYRKKMMMSKQEAKEEHKERDGNPEVKQRIRSIQRDIATKRMMKEVPEADAIVTNPTHISVAIKYDSEKHISPVVVAKGKDHIALKIREIAKANNVPIVENVPLARALNKTVDLGDPVPRNLYKAVAEVLSFVYKLKRKEKALSA